MGHDRINSHWFQWLGKTQNNKQTKKNIKLKIKALFCVHIIITEMSRHRRMDSRRVRVVFFFLPLPTKHSGKKCPLIAFGFSVFRKSGLLDFFFSGKIPSLHQVLHMLPFI